VTLSPVTDLLRERIGLDPETLGPTSVARAVQARMEAHGLAAAADYAARLVTDPQEFQVLLDDVTVPETWFFRGGEVFSFLARRIAEIVRMRQPPEQYRVLSVPCSTGEEPYSLAIALAEAGVSPAACSIWGIDINARWVERARQGRFGDFAFRQTAADLQQRYFQYSGDGWELQAAIRTRVSFRQANLLDPFFLAAEKPFDLIFCRNLFIYMDPSARRRALDTLERLLAAEGLLCTGHAEPLEFADPRFQRSGAGEYFLYQRRSACSGNPPALVSQSPLSLRYSAWESNASAPPVSAADASGRPPPVGSSGEGAGGGRSPPDSVLKAAWAGDPPSAPVIPTEVTAEDLLRQARQQADLGQFDAAFSACQACLDRSEPSADVFGLLGVLHQARQQTEEAMRCFERALYLNPEHRDSLTHLMLLCQEQGDLTQSARLRRRLERIVSGGES
jgi:chemotaxis protein methyltransferase WspC